MHNQCQMYAYLDKNKPVEKTSEKTSWRQDVNIHKEHEEPS